MLSLRHSLPAVLVSLIGTVAYCQEPDTPPTGTSHDQPYMLLLETLIDHVGEGRIDDAVAVLTAETSKGVPESRAAPACSGADGGTERAEDGTNSASATAAGCTRAAPRATARCCGRSPASTLAAGSTRDMKWSPCGRFPVAYIVSMPSHTTSGSRSSIHSRCMNLTESGKSTTFTGTTALPN